MQILSWTFMCDHTDCTVHLLAPYEDEVEAYIFLAGTDWQTTHEIPGVLRRHHYCPDHAAEAFE